MIKNKLYFWAILLMVSACATEGNVDPVFERQFVKYYGTEGDQSGADLLVNDDGTMVLLGNSLSLSGAATAFLMKVDPKGGLIWRRQVGTAGENAVDVELIRSGSYAGELVVALNSGPETSSKIRLVRVRQAGPSIDSLLIGHYQTQVIKSITSLVSRDAYVITGYADQNYMPEPEPINSTNDKSDILAYEVPGDFTSPLIRLVTKGGEQDGAGIRIHERMRGTDGELILFGYSDRPNLQNTFRFNFYYDRIIDGTAVGSIVGSETEEEVLSCVIKTPPQNGEGYLMVGTSRTGASSPSDIYLVKYNNSFVYKSLDSKISIGVSATAVSADNAPDGYYILANGMASGQLNDIILIKLSPNGDQQWIRSFGAIDAEDTGAAVAGLPDGRIAVVGTIQLQTRKKLALIVLNGNGEI